MTHKLPQTMKAMAIDRFGGLEVLKLHELPLPQIDDNEILIRVESAGVGVWDPFEREGGFAQMMGQKPRFPYVQGSDGAGTVVQVGSKVTGFKEGEEVYAYAFMSPKGGFYAEYTAVKASQASAIPGKLDVIQAGALCIDAVTAYRGLDDTLGLKGGQSLLVFGASGGVGHLGLQLAKRMGARVLAVASGEDGVALAKALGADAVVEGHTGDVVKAAREFSPQGIDAALMTSGGAAADKALEALRDGGRVAYPNGVEPAPKARPGIRVKSYDGIPDPEVIQRINALIEQGPFQVHIARTFPLQEAAEAQKALEKHFLGKLALRP